MFSVFAFTWGFILGSGTFILIGETCCNVGIIGLSLIFAISFLSTTSPFIVIFVVSRGDWGLLGDMGLTDLLFSLVGEEASCLSYESFLLSDESSAFILPSSESVDFISDVFVSALWWGILDGDTLDDTLGDDILRGGLVGDGVLICVTLWEDSDFIVVDEDGSDLIFLLDCLDNCGGDCDNMSFNFPIWSSGESFSCFDGVSSTVTFLGSLAIGGGCLFLLKKESFVLVISLSIGCFFLS